MKPSDYLNWEAPPRGVWKMTRNIFVFLCIVFALYQLLQWGFA